MAHSVLPVTLVATFLENSSDPETAFSRILPTLGEVLQCDRCFLYLRNPFTRLGKVPYCWVRNSQFPTVFDEDWKPEPPNLSGKDPMFAAALRTDPTIFVEDVECASSELVNAAFERDNFGHRALIHAHLCQEGVLWGVLQPCVFDQPRIWTDFDRATIAEIVERITPLAVTYVKAEFSLMNRE